jgi:hypothetical protein
VRGFYKNGWLPDWVRRPVRVAPRAVADRPASDILVSDSCTDLPTAAPPASDPEPHPRSNGMGRREGMRRAGRLRLSRP